MSATFNRWPQPGGDSGAWAGLNDAQNEAALGALTGRLYNDGGALKIPPCIVGVDDGVNKGRAKFSAAETISLAAGSNSNWLKIELSISGAVGTLAAADIAGATDPTIIPASVRAAYNGLKGGFYLTATKRLIGLAWKSAAGVLLAVVNFDGQKIWLSQLGLHTATIREQREPGAGFILSASWDMDAVDEVAVVLGCPGFENGTKSVSAIVKSNAGALYPVDRYFNSADPNLLSGGFVVITGSGFYFDRRNGGYFDAPAFNAATIYAVVHMREF